MAELAKKEQVFEYVASDGQKLILTFEIVKKYLVQGHPEFLTLQEAMYFLNICRARKLNPFVRDCYLVKYSEADPAAIITSIDFFRKRAKAQKDCRGWKKGVIVCTKDGQIKDTNGLVSKDETLLGGWFEAKPSGWDDPLRVEVNLNGYIKKTKKGDISQFWQPEKQPTMIAKVAEAQGLRTVWPDEFQQLYTEEEAEAEVGKTIDITTEPPKAIEEMVAKFDSQIPEGTDREKLAKYLTICATHFEKTVDEIKTEVVQNPGNFWEQFDAWAKKQEKPPKKEKLKPKKWQVEFLQKMGKAKEQLNQFLGQSRGEEYYKILGECGYEKSSQVPSEGEAQKVFQAMNKRLIELLEKGIIE